MRAAIHIAREQEPRHIIRYHAKFEGELPYLVAHECGHLIRIREAPEDYRQLPFSDREHRSTVANELGRDLRRLARKGLPGRAIGELTRLWHDGLVRQLTNCPADMRIERWLHERYAGLRDIQESALRRQLEENARVLRPEVRAFTPYKVYEASSTMNAAFAYYMSLLLDDPTMIGPYRLVPCGKAGRTLAEDVWADEDRGYQSDIEEADKWARIFAVEKWFGWRPLDR